MTPWNFSLLISSMCIFFCIGLDGLGAKAVSLYSLCEVGWQECTRHEWWWCAHPLHSCTHTLPCALGCGVGSVLFLITEVLQSSKRSSLVETNKNRSGVAANAPAPWRAQVERGDQSPRQRQWDSRVPPKPSAKRDTPAPPAPPGRRPFD